MGVAGSSAFINRPTIGKTRETVTFLVASKVSMKGPTGLKVASYNKIIVSDTNSGKAGQGRAGQGRQGRLGLKKGHTPAERHQPIVLRLASGHGRQCRHHSPHNSQLETHHKFELLTYTHSPKHK